MWLADMFQNREGKDGIEGSIWIRDIVDVAYLKPNVLDAFLGCPSTRSLYLTRFSIYADDFPWRKPFCEAGR
jgi:hypothetical protein